MVLVLILVFFLNIIIGIYALTPDYCLAFHAGEKDQGHNGPKEEPPVEPEKPDEKCASSMTVGSEIFVGPGDYSYTEKDLFIAGRGISLEVIRTHDSQEMYEGPFGYGWKFNYDIRLIFTTSGEKEIVTLRRGDGVRLNFTQNDDGSYSAPLGRRDYLMQDNDGSYKWYENGCPGCGGSGTWYHFDCAGGLIEIVDSNGNEITFGYDVAGKLIIVTDPSRRMLNINYGQNNKISRIIDPAGRIFTYNYDDKGDLISYTDPAGNTKSYTYDTAHNITNITDAKGNSIYTMKYDELNRIYEYTKFGGTWRIYYYPDNNNTEVYDPKGNKWIYTYNDTGQTTQIKDPTGNTTTKEWDENLYLKVKMDEREHSTTYEYDERGNRTKIIDALGTETTYVYHETFNKIKSKTNGLWYTTTYDYDENANLIKITDALGKITSMTYDQYGQLETMTNANGYTTTYTYDAYGNLNSITDALGNITSMEYDILGNLKKVIDAAGNNITYTYDVLGNRLSETDKIGNITHYTYDQNGNRTSIVDAQNNVTFFSYNTYGLMDSITDANGNQTSFEYDLNGNLKKIIDANGHTVTYEYDGLDRLIKTTYPDGTTEINKYTQGILDYKIDRNGQKIDYGYDSLNRLKSKIYPDSSQVIYDYDDIGRLVSVTDGNSTVNHKYNAMNRVIQVNQDGKIIAYQYDNVGNKKMLTYADGSYITYNYDPIDRLDQIMTDNNQVIADYTYDDLLKKMQIDFLNGTQTLYQYDQADRLWNLTNKITSSQSIISQFNYGYDMVGNRISMNSQEGTHLYVYDNIYQFQNVNYPEGYPFHDMAYNFDGVGNRSSTANGGTVAYTSNILNQYTNVGGTAYTYDVKGNLTSDGINCYTYDYENHLIQVVTPSDTISFTYDPLGRRISKTDSSGTTKYYYDGDHVIEEYNGSGMLLRKFIYSSGIDKPIMMDDGTNQYYYHFDGLGSVKEITSSSGSIIEKYLYDVYGKFIIKDGFDNILPESIIGNPYAFTARRYDPETGIYYYRARYYSPSLGRFLSPDPIYFTTRDVNIYLYVKNNPINFQDPYGLAGIAIDFGGGYGSGWCDISNSIGGGAGTGIFIGARPDPVGFVGSYAQIGSYIYQSFADELPGARIGLGANFTIYFNDSREFFQGNMNYTMMTLFIVALTKYTNPCTGETTGLTISLGGKGLGLTGFERGTVLSWSAALQE